MHELAIQKHEVTEFVIDVNELETGLSCRIFDKSCETYNDSVTLLQRPGFRRLDLTLLADGQYNEDMNWLSFRSGYLKLALEHMEDPHHVNLVYMMSMEYQTRIPTGSLSKRYFPPVANGRTSDILALGNAG